uniref:Very low density lipoprotein receptor n=1 Tax=Homo sapiens TaxID=9606 RepID=A0A7P0T8F7_HUMAN
MGTSALWALWLLLALCWAPRESGATGTGAVLGRRQRAKTCAAASGAPSNPGECGSGRGEKGEKPNVNPPNSSAQMVAVLRCCGNVMGMKTVLTAVMKRTV